MKLKLFSRNSARTAWYSLIIAVGLSALYGCSSNTKPTFPKETIAQAISDICMKEYKIFVRTKLVGSTLWIYLPLKDLLTKAEKPEKYTENFNVEKNKVDFKDRLLSVEYLIKNIPEQEKFQEYKYDKSGIEKLNNVWKTLRRVVFSMERSKEKEPEFYCVVTADIKNGFETREFFYYLDLKKVSYGFISWTEYQHRAVQESGASADIIDDREGKHLVYTEMTMEEFIADQIAHRIKLKFNKPEVAKNADIDREITKIVANVVRIYDAKDFDEVALFNEASQHKTVLNQAALLSKPADIPRF